MVHLHFLISAVSNEFGSYRPELKHYLDHHNVTVKIQEDFPTDDIATLEQLATYVASCDAVVHLIGRQTGYTINNKSIEWLQRTYPTLATDIPDLNEVLDGTYAASYTQWEAYLARLMGKKLFIFEGAPSVLPDKQAPTHEKPVQSQSQHLKRLRAMNLYVAKTPFRSVEHLVAELSHSSIVKLLVEAELAVRTSGKHNVKPNNLPLSLGSLFKGRGPFIEHLRKEFEKAASGHKALYGLGGIGKTQLAVEYAWHYENDYNALLFVRADTPADLEVNLAALCGALVLDLPEKTVSEQEVRLIATLKWLAEHPGWLLIVDNVDSSATVNAAEKWLLQLNSGHVLVTTRVNEWPQQVECLGLDVLQPDDAQDFLLERTDGHRPPQPSDATDALALAHDLGYLALALVQAGAYIEANNVTIQEYRTNWAANEENVRGWFNEKRMGYPSSVAVTWQTSFDQLNPPAQTLLNRLAWFSAEPVPLSLLKVPIPGAEPINMRDARHDLTRYSLAVTTSDKLAFSIHKLVQEVTRTKLIDEQNQEEPFTESLNWINAAFIGDPQDVRTWSILSALRSHALEVSMQYAPEFGNPGPTGQLLNNLAQLLDAKAELRAAEPLMRRFLAITEQNYGSDHPQVATGLNNLASLLHDTNRLEEAEPLFRRALAIREQNDISNHPLVATSLNNLARLLYDTNRLEEAEQLFRRALVISEQNYGSDHPQVATGLNNLARLLQDTNRLEDAEQLFRRALVISEQNYGSNHPSVAIRLNNLALLLLETNRLEEAEPLFRRALSITEQNYSSDHPSVAISLNNLARLLYDTNRLEEAEPLFRRALSITEQNYSSDHPSVAISLNNLARLLHDTNRLEEAEPLMRRTVVILLDFYKHTQHIHADFQMATSNYMSLLQQMDYTERQIITALEVLGIELEA
jgi:tetratricopeptide (TPR) repeat protein